MTTFANGVSSLDKIASSLRNKAEAAKQAAVKRAAQNDPDPTKDHTEVGTVSVPNDPNGQPPKTQVTPPETNTNVTKDVPVPPVAETVDENKLASQVAKVAQGIKGLAAKFQKKTAATEDEAKGLPQGATTQTNTDVPKQEEKKVPTAAPKDKAETPAPEVKKDEVKDMPEKTENKDASAADVDLTDVDDVLFHAKLAKVILATEEGRQDAFKHVQRANGAEIANNVIKAAMVMEERAQELEELEKSGAFVAQELLENASETELAQIVKIAKTLQTGRDLYTTDIEKAAYDAGAESAAEMMDSGMMDQELPESPEDLTPAILTALDEMVQNGEIPPEAAEEILQVLAQEGAVEGGGEAPVIPTEGEEEMPEEEKEARTKSASAREAVINLFYADKK